MVKLFIPSLKTRIRLTKDWTFVLYNESRNRVALETLAPMFRSSTGLLVNSWTCTIPEGAVLTVQRVYIRQGQSDYDSVTFTCKMDDKSFRFWAKLYDVNTIEYQLSTD